MPQLFSVIFAFLWIVGCQPEVSLPMAEPTQLIPSSNMQRAKVRHILLPYEGAWRANTRRSRSDALQQIQGYHSFLKEGVDFGYLANQHSEDPQKKEGGLIGIVERGQTVEEFEDLLFHLQIHEISDVIETGFGFHILQRLPLDERMLIHIEVDSAQGRDEVAEGLQTGLDPRDLAREHSIAPHGLRGGELGWFERRDLDTPFVEPVFALEIGNCTAPIARSTTTRQENSKSPIETVHWHFFCRQG